MWRKIVWLGIVILVGVAIDVIYLYSARTSGGVGFKVKITPDIS